MTQLLTIFWLFVRVNLLSSSGPSSVGLLYREAVGSLMSESEFIEAVGISSALPGSDALQLAMFVGYAAGGTPGAAAALLGSILPPTLLMFGLVSALQQIRGEAWVSNFVRGLSPAVAVLMAMVAWQVLQGTLTARWTAAGILAALSFVALLLKLPPPLVLLASGLAGVVLFR